MNMLKTWDFNETFRVIIAFGVALDYKVRESKDHI